MVRIENNHLVPVLAWAGLLSVLEWLSLIRNLAGDPSAQCGGGGPRTGDGTRGHECGSELGCCRVVDQCAQNQKRTSRLRIEHVLERRIHVVAGALEITQHQRAKLLAEHRALDTQDLR